MTELSPMAPQGRRRAGLAGRRTSGPLGLRGQGAARWGTCRDRGDRRDPALPAICEPDCLMQLVLLRDTSSAKRRSRLCKCLGSRLAKPYQFLVRRRVALRAVRASAGVVVLTASNGFSIKPLTRALLPARLKADWCGKNMSETDSIIAMCGEHDGDTHQVNHFANMTILDLRIYQ